MHKLTKNIYDWAEEKGILAKATLQAQLLKSLEEVGETIEAYIEDDKAEIIDGIGDITVTLIILAYLADSKQTVKIISDNLERNQTRDEEDDMACQFVDRERVLLKMVVYLSQIYKTFNVLEDEPHEFFDSIAKVMSCLELFCILQNKKMEDCLQTAYDVIKGRTGEMKDGVFVKDE
jgi:phosphoribosyl-ATP pyrophosphohydrolase